MKHWPTTDREWARSHIGCNVTTCPNGKCQATGECVDKPVSYCTPSGLTFCKGNNNRCASCPDIPLRVIESPPIAPEWLRPDGIVRVRDPVSFVPPNDPRLKPTNPKDAIGDKKVPLWLCSPIAKAQWAVAQFVGMVKYGAWNWRSAGIRSSIYLSAMQRHLDAYMSGEEVDPIDQTSHLGHIMACAAILIDAKAAGKLNDDRPPSVGLRETYAAVEAQMAKARENYGHMNPKHFTIADTSPST
ncbi:hypothetical protein AOQ73_05955 [Bradyrhizobium pachyrhizi]|uniref:dATP/dGTP diphosphohydrolase domain-containing protein n=1 Tax=Bradyrhizobium pachyrhizi TaxID=280333 RepID=UPI0007050F08|nr:dATP/dGTP diphosphohydrolase domain-containing protein [Bradyrhizobium pachyrhizi]KRQ11950.1 hypothetical protein AOQ73_05955 [Bradyrhizobium pachyrhizi]